MPCEPIVSSRPTEFFRELVQEAMHAQGVESEEETEYYLVQLLERHIRMHTELLDRPLALGYLEALCGEPARRFQRFKQVGDSALFITGLFNDSLEKTVVQPTYYVQLGQLAYRRVAETTSRSLRELFEGLALHFLDLVRVLGEISTRDLFTSDKDTLRVYRRWLLTRGAADAAVLLRRGIIPAEPSTARH